MKKRLRKMISMLLAAAMVLGMCVTGYAADEYTITVDPAYSGETYTAYKVFDATYSGTGNVEGEPANVAYTIDSSSPWYTQVADATDVFKLTKINDSDIYVVEIAGSSVSEEDIVEVLSKIPSTAVIAAEATADTVADENGHTGTTTVTLDVSDSGAGYYFVTTSMGSVVSIGTSAPSVTISDKNPEPTLTKELENITHGGLIEGESGDEENVTEGDKDTAKIGDIIEFEIRITNAAHKSALTLHDYTSVGLSYYGDEYVKVYLNKISLSTMVAEANYTLESVDLKDGCDYEITFAPEWLDDLSSTDVIIVTYEAVVDEKAESYNYNDAYITYGAAGKSVTVETETDVYGLLLEKHDDFGKVLDGATFTLAYADGSLVGFVKDTTTDDEGNVRDLYTVYDPEEHAEGYEPVTNIEIGSANIFGLDEGTYTLTETIAPDGYNILTSPLTVIVGENGSITVTGDSSASATGNEIIIINHAGSILPGTGGMGTTIFYIVGIVLMIGAAAFFVARKRISKEE